MKILQQTQGKYQICSPSFFLKSFFLKLSFVADSILQDEYRHGDEIVLSEMLASPLIS